MSKYRVSITCDVEGEEEDAIELSEMWSMIGKIKGAVELVDEITLLDHGEEE